MSRKDNDDPAINMDFLNTIRCHYPSVDSSPIILYPGRIFKEDAKAIINHGFDLQEVGYGSLSFYIICLTDEVELNYFKLLYGDRYRCWEYYT